MSLSRIVRKLSPARARINKAVVESLETRRLLSSYGVNELTLGGDYAEVIGLNEAGQVAGSAYTADNSSSNAFLFTDRNNNGQVDAGEMLDLGTLGGTASVATQLNESGQVAGYSFIENNAGIRAFLFTDRNNNGQVDENEMLDLGTLGTTSMATLLNNAGQVAGQSQNLLGQQRAFLFTDANNNGTVDTGEMADLGSLGGATVVPVAINDAGQVAGYSETGDGSIHAFLYTDRNGNKLVDAGEMLDLGTLGGSSSFVTGMNEAGQVIGYSYTAGDAEIHGFIFTDINGNGEVDPGEMSDLGTFGGALSQAMFINEAGQVAGTATDESGASHAFLYTDLNNNGQVDPGEVADLGTAGGVQANVVDLNEAGQVLGTYDLADGTQRSFLYTDANNNGVADSGEVADLGTLGGSYTIATDLTNDGKVIGISTNEDDSALFGFLYTDKNNNGLVDAGEMDNLNALIPGDVNWVLEQPTRINDAGDIIGVGYHNGVFAPFLATVVESSGPVEEPATIQDVEAAVRELIQNRDLGLIPGGILLVELGVARNQLEAGRPLVARVLLAATKLTIEALHRSRRIATDDYEMLKGMIDEVLENLV